MLIGRTKCITPYEYVQIKILIDDGLASDSEDPKSITDLNSDIIDLFDLDLDPFAVDMIHRFGKEIHTIDLD